MTTPIDDLVHELRGPYSTAFPRSLARRAADAIEARDRRIAELSETANNEQRARLQADVAYMQAEARAEAMRVVLAADEAILEAIPQRFFGQPGIARLVSNANAARAAPSDAERDAALAEFTEYFVKNYPGPNTIIGNPHWHAPKIFRAAKHALRAALAAHAPAQERADEVFTMMRHMIVEREQANAAPPPSPPDDLVRRLREDARSEDRNGRSHIAVHLRKAADAIERLMGPCLSEHPGCVYCMERGTPVKPGCVCPKCGDRLPTEGHYAMWRERDAAMKAIAAADAIREWVDGFDDEPDFVLIRDAYDAARAALGDAKP